MMETVINSLAKFAFSVHIKQWNTKKLIIVSTTYVRSLTQQLANKDFFNQKTLKCVPLEIFFSNFLPG